MTDADALRARLAAEVADAAGVWAPSFAQVPRHMFVTDTVWRHDRSVGGPNDLLPLSRDVDPDGWLELVYCNAPVNTQVDDGHPGPDGTGHEVSSSTSQPSVMADMLTALDAHPGHRVLEVGTGTGWNAALLAHRLGAGNVTSVEVDPVVATHARVALAATGFGDVQVITGDGAHGHPDGAPSDRVLATVGVGTVPYAWVAQTRPGGRLVVPVTGTFQSPGVLVLHVDDTGAASGRLAGPAAFMVLRSQRMPRPRGRELDVAGGARSCTDVHPYWVSTDRDAATAVGMRMPGLYRQFTAGDVAGEGTAWLLHPASGSWAAVELVGDGPWEVRQDGPRRLWDEALATYLWWQDAGSPAVSDWRFTVSPKGQRVALDPVASATAVA